MKLRTIIWLILVGLLTALLVRLCLRKPPFGSPQGPGTGTSSQRAKLPVVHSGQPPRAQLIPPPAEPCVPAAPGEFRVSDDAELKRGDFWLEQPLEVTAQAAPGAHLLDLYLTLDTQSRSGVRLRLRSTEIALEEGAVAADGREAPIVLVKAALPQPLTGGTVLGVLWQGGKVSAWLGAQEVLVWQPGQAGRLPSATPLLLTGPSAAWVAGAGLRLGARRTLPLNAISFNDNFMRDTNSGVWRPLSGKWELTALAFPERSANPFSLRVSFGSDEPADDKLYQGRTHDHAYGLGIIISGIEGTLHVARITGGGPAARAGLAENDIFLEVDGMPMDGLGSRHLQPLLLRGFGGDVRLKMLRPGEKQAREFRITREHYKWGTPAEGIPIPPMRGPLAAGPDEVALIAAGEPGWGNYAAEAAVKPLGSGGMGLAIGVLSPQDYLVFRWRGPAGRQPALRRESAPTPLNKPAPEGAVSTDRLQLVRVARGKGTVLSETAAGYRPYEFYRLGVDWNGAVVTCSVDGNQVLAAAVPDLKRGQIALYALKGDPVFFDDVHIYSDRKALAAARQPAQAVNRIFAGEENMEVWGNPALEWGRDTETGWAIHKARFPGEQAVVLDKPRFKDLEIALHCAGNPDPAVTRFSIKGGEAVLSWHGIASSASARVGDGPFERIAVKGLEADVDGNRLQVRPVDITGLPPGLDLTHIAIRGLKNLGDPNAVHVSSSNLLEYTFDSAPTDWKVECGRWGLLNKWICDPRWSWFGGRSKTLAALWNKYVFSGDITVDAYVALMMQQEDPPFERPGDYNLTICGDGVNLDSGYTLIFGGDCNTWTRLYRKGQLVAASTQEAHRVFSDRIRHPDKPDLHLRWFHLKLEKRGGTVSFYRDDALAFSFADPEPLPEGRVAFWTLDNGFLLSRVRIAHSGMKAAPFEPRRSHLFEDSRVINMFDGEVGTSVERHALPDPILTALNAPKNSFRPANADPLPAASALDGPVTPAYRVVNGAGGGPFALQWRSLLLDPEARGVLRFAYRIEPGANVDFYLLDVAGGRDLDPRRTGAYRWRLTGPRDSDEFAPLVGEVPGVQADGRWHAVQADLHPSWRAFWQQRGFRRPRSYLLRPMLGNLSNQGYLLAGMNGNHGGAAYSVSNLMFFSPRETDAPPPTVERVVWPYDADGDGRSVAVAFSNRGGCGILAESLQATLNDDAVPRDVLEFDHVKQTLRLDLLKLNLPPLTTAPTLKLRLLPFQDRAQKESAEPFAATYAFDLAAATRAAKPVAAPLVTVEMTGGGDVVPGSAPLALAEVSPITPVARLQESADAPKWAPWGWQRSLQVVSVRDGSAFGFALNNVSYGLRQWPYLLLDYRMPPETPVNLHFSDHTGALHALVLGDTGDELDPLSHEIASRAGPPAGFISDDTWRRTVVPLQRLFADKIPQLTSASIRGFALNDNGWRGSRRAMQYRVHRIQPLPAGRPADYKFSWQAADLSGITDYASCLDDKPDTDPLGKRELAAGDTLDAALARRGAGLKDGWNYLHVRVRDGAGVWSAPAHQPFLLDNTPPQVVRTEPPAGGSCAGQTLRVFLNEEHGLDLAALRLSVNGQLVAGRHNLHFDHATNCLTCGLWAAGVPWAEGGKVSVDLYGLKDLLGNQAAAPFTFSFTADRSTDRKGPAITHARFSAPAYGSIHNRQIDMETSFSLDFEEHTGHVHALRDCSMEWLDDPALAGFGRRAVRFTALDDDVDAQIMLHKNPWYLDRAPVLHFDYKADPGMRLDILVEVLGQWLSIRFTGDGAAPEGGKAIGRVEAVLADGSWRHASVDLRSMIDAACPDLPVRIANKVILSAHGRDGCKRGSSILLDNVELSRARGAGGRIEWRAEADASGIAGYSYVLDQTATTTPPEQISHTGNCPMAGVVSCPGVWYAHIRACDQAGNWGPTRTLRLDFGIEH